MDFHTFMIGAAALGNAVSSFTAPIAVGVTVFVARRELAKWRTQKRDETRANVAARLAGAGLRALDVLRDLATPLYQDAVPLDTVSTDDDSPVAQRRSEREMLARWCALLDAQWAAADSVFEELRAAYDQALVVLPAPQLQPLQAIEDLRREIRSSQITWTMPQVYRARGYESLYQRGFGLDLRKQIASLRGAVVDAMRPFATFEHVDTESKRLSSSTMQSLPGGKAPGATASEKAVAPPKASAA